MPSRTIQVESKNLELRVNRITSSELNSRLPQVSEAADRESSESERIEDQNSKTPAITIKTLGIGEHYLEQRSDDLEYPEDTPSTSSSKALRLAKKKEKELQEFVKKSLSGIEIFKIKQIAGRYFTETEACLSNYSKECPRKFMDLLVNGSPMKFRWSLWKVKINPEQYFINGLYEKLRDLRSIWERDIKKDIHRTFPDEPYFSSDEYGLVGQNHLYKVLVALSNYFPHVGYCQGMNFIIAFLLMISGGNELETFWLFVTLARNPEFNLIGLFEDGFPFINLHVSLFHQIFKKELPALYDHVQSLMLPDSLWISNWLCSLFLYALPTKKVIRVWDVMLTEDIFFLVKVAVALMKLYEKEILGLDTNGFNDLFRFIKSEKCIKHPKVSASESTIIFQAKEVDIEQLLKIAQKMKISKEKIGECVRVYKETMPAHISDEILDFYINYHKNVTDPQQFSNFQQMIDLKILSSALREEVGNQMTAPRTAMNFDGLDGSMMILKDLTIIHEIEEEEPSIRVDQDKSLDKSEIRESQTEKKIIGEECIEIHHFPTDGNEDRNPEPILSGKDFVDMKVAFARQETVLTTSELNQEIKEQEFTPITGIPRKLSNVTEDDGFVILSPGRQFINYEEPADISKQKLESKPKAKTENNLNHVDILEHTIY